MEDKLKIDEIMLIKCMHGHQYCKHCKQRISTDCNLPVVCGHCGYPCRSEKLNGK